MVIKFSLFLTFQCQCYIHCHWHHPGLALVLWLTHWHPLQEHFRLSVFPIVKPGIVCNTNRTCSIPRPTIESIRILSIGCEECLVVWGHEQSDQRVVQMEVPPDPELFYHCEKIQYDREGRSDSISRCVRGKGSAWLFSVCGEVLE